MTDDSLAKIQKVLLAPPRLSLVSDHAIDAKDIGTDNFDLPFRAGPLYDVLRHPKTITPLAAAIYGDWGAGKTSAMRWVQGRLDDWHEHGKEAEDKITVHTVWFAPWKYQNREDVWRGLIAEVMIECMSQTDNDGLLEEAKDLGAYLGKSLWGIISSLKIKAGPIGVDGDKLTKALKIEAENYLAPEAAYLHNFETTFKTWVQKCLGKNQRMVVFIDDLDRCLPEIALQVLEALKLYLDIEGLAFVVGVDPEVINDQVGKRYEDLGLSKAKGKQYLAKMFQIDITLKPNERQIKDFQDDLLDKNDVWNEIDFEHQVIFKQVIHNLAKGSPRETKRLVNSALIAGAGVKMTRLAHDDTKVAPTTAQGIQVFFVEQVLKRYFRDHEHLVARDEGTRFFQAWHEKWADLEEDNVYLNPVDLRKVRELKNKAEQSGEAINIEDEYILERVPEPLWYLIEGYPQYVDLLGDKNLFELIKIEYPDHGEELSIVTDDNQRLEDDNQRLVDEAIASELGKTAEYLTIKDFLSIAKIDLSSMNITSLNSLEKLQQLQELNISNTEIHDLTPIRGLHSLYFLDISDTPIETLTPLHQIKGLNVLRVRGCNIADIEKRALRLALPNLNIIR